MREIDGAALRELRRWLRDEVNIRATRRLAPPAATFWHNDSRAATIGLRLLIERAVSDRVIDGRDAEAWSKYSALDGKRHFKKDIASNANLRFAGSTFIWPGSINY